MNKLRYIYERVKLMTLSEAVYRAKWKLRKDIVYPRRIGKEPLLFADSDARGKAFSQFKEHHVLWFSQQSQDEIKTSFEDCVSSEQQKAFWDDIQKIMDHMISVFEVKDVPYGKDINWRMDPKTKKVWSLEYYGKINHNDTSVGGIRYVWEFNRFPHFYKLGAAYQLSGDEKYAQEIVDQIYSWIKNNPYLLGINWFSQMELALRMMAWTWALHAIKDSKVLTEEIWGDIVQNIYLHADIVQENPSLFTSANNHLIGEEAALVVLGNLLPFEPFTHWKKHSEKTLDSEMEKQWYLDGVNKEQTNNYQAFSMDFYFLAAIWTGGELPQKHRKLLQKSLHFLSEWMTTKEEIQFVGDSDEGLVSGFASFIPNFSSLMATGALLFNDGDLKRYGTYDLKNFWFMGPQSKKKFESVPVNTTDLPSTFYKEGGYAVFRNTSTHMKAIMDFGALGYLAPAGHGHCDALALTLTLGNHDVLVDPGTYLYHTGGKWRRHFKTTASHNTATVDTKEQAKYISHAIWNNVFDTQLLGTSFGNAPMEQKSISDEEFVEASHSGFGDIVHRRKIVNILSEKKLVIHDSFDSEKECCGYSKKNTAHEHTYRLYFHLHPHVLVEKKKNGLVLTVHGKKILMQFDALLDLQLIQGTEKTELGWYSPRFGVKLSTTTIIAKIKQNNTTTLQF